MEHIKCPFPGYERFSDEFVTLIATYPPPFIYIQDMQTLRTTFSVVDTLLRDLSNAPPSESLFKICYSRVNGISCFTSRLLFESIINSLVDWEPSWEEGCANWGADVDVKWNENMDTFLHGLRAAHKHIRTLKGIALENAKGKERMIDKHEQLKFVIVVEHAERLKDSLPELLVPLTRLAELAMLELSIIFISSKGWEEIRPPLGASPDPFYMDIVGLTKGNIVEKLISDFSNISGASSDDILANPYHPSLKSLYSHFATVLCDVCYPFTHDPQELQYIAAARWPGFCAPIIDEHRRKIIALHTANDDSDVDMEQNHTTDGIEFTPPSEDIRMRLSKIFNLSLTKALEELVPRLNNATDWAWANEPPANILSLNPSTQLLAPRIVSQDLGGMKALPRMSKFILLASFLASTNTAKSDLRVFGRGLDEKKRKRRVTKATGKSKGPPKVPQRLLGPTPFALDRMIAILGALLEENDVYCRLLDSDFNVPGEYTDMEITRVGVLSAVTELNSIRLLHRTGPLDRLDGPPQFKSTISYDTALALAKQLNVKLNDLLWDPF